VTFYGGRACQIVHLSQQQPSSIADHGGIDNSQAIVLNRALVQSMIAQVKPHLVILRDDTHDIQTWIRMRMPEISSGADTSVEIQQMVKDYAENAEVQYLRGITSEMFVVIHSCRRHPGLHGSELLYTCGPCWLYKCETRGERETAAVAGGATPGRTCT